MTALLCWIFVALVLLVLTGFLGRRVTYIEVDNGAEVRKSGGWLGILIDYRKRYSLTHFQIVAWSLVLLSLVGGIFLARLLMGSPVDQLLNFDVPQNLLVLAGISGGSAVLATAIKTTKNTTTIQDKSGKTEFVQMFMVEEGGATDQVVDPTKFQNFVLTVIAVAAYVVQAAVYLYGVNLTQAGALGPDHLPYLGEGLLWLVGISGSAYVSGKIPSRT